MKNIAYFNGEFMPYSEVNIDLEDRGYLFADGIYEVINSYNGKAFKMEEHFERLKNSAKAVNFNDINYDKLIKDAYKLIEKNGLKDAKLYLQVTRGTAERSHAYPDNLTVNILMLVKKLKRYSKKYYEEGVKAITVPDERWSKCYIKSLMLLPNCMAKTKAHRAGALEAIQVRDGFVTEGTSTNLFIVKNNEVVTPPATNYILNGITRQVALEIGNKLELRMTEKSIPLANLYNADEVFLSGTTTEIMPVVKVDGKIINDGKPGEISLKVLKEFRKLL